MFALESRIQLLGKSNIDNANSVSYLDVIKYLGPQLTDERKLKIDQVVKQRCFGVSVVLEDIYDRGNASAVFRSSEAMGFGQVHLIQKNEKFKESQRTTAGADKWLEVKKWWSTSDCVQELKRQKKKIVVTHLSSQSIPIHEFDFSQDCALVLGNEKDGVSPEMIQASDAAVILPMQGFVQSFNISVAAALSLWHIREDRNKRLGKSADLTSEQQEILKAHYYLRTLDSGIKTLTELKSRGEI